MPPRVLRFGLRLTRFDYTIEHVPGKLLQSTLPDFPWERVATDLFELKGVTYVVLVDYYSRYIEIQKLQSTTAASVIIALKAVFSRHGVPAVLMSDNGPQYSSREMSEFTHITSSPHYPQSNGQAERVVKTAKHLLLHSPDLYMALLSYRATPLAWYGLSPAELLMGRRLRTNVPQLKAMLVPNWPHVEEFRDATRGTMLGKSGPMISDTVLRHCHYSQTSSQCGLNIRDLQYPVKSYNRLTLPDHIWLRHSLVNFVVIAVTSDQGVTTISIQPIA